MRVRPSRRVVVVAVVVLCVAIGGIAFAYWTTSGAGSGSGNAGSGAAVVVNQTGTPTGIYPGAAVALAGTFDNPNPGQVYITAVTASIAPFSAQADGAKPACTQADFSITGTAPVGAQIASGNSVGAWTGLTLNMINSAANQDNCKTVTVPVTYAAS